VAALISSVLLVKTAPKGRGTEGAGPSATATATWTDLRWKKATGAVGQNRAKS
jgi:hypothetical protein